MPKIRFLFSCILPTLFIVSCAKVPEQTADSPRSEIALIPKPAPPPELAPPQESAPSHKKKKAKKGARAPEPPEADIVRLSPNAVPLWPDEGGGLIAGPSGRGRDVERGLWPARLLMKASNIPPPDVGAYGVVAFDQGATSASRARMTMTCHAFIAALPERADLPSKVLSQIWLTNPPGVRLPATVSAASR
jgi:hypothetical protein